MRSAYLDYAMSVIVSRALPDVRDGLKPVQRRILYAMNEMGLRHNIPYRKSAGIVGEVLKEYHPHGDTAVYDALVRMAQDFSHALPAGGRPGQLRQRGRRPPGGHALHRSPSARHRRRVAGRYRQRYGRLRAQLRREGSWSRRCCRPRLPNLLLNGAAGIAVGMATNIPPHNLSELADAITF